MLFHYFFTLYLSLVYTVNYFLRISGITKICNIKITSQCKILIVPEEGWFGQPKYSAYIKTILRCAGFCLYFLQSEIAYSGSSINSHSCSRDGSRLIRISLSSLLVNSCSLVLFRQVSIDDVLFWVSLPFHWSGRERGSKGKKRDPENEVVHECNFLGAWCPNNSRYFLAASEKSSFQSI